MTKVAFLWGVAGLLALCAAGFAGWMLSLPSPRSTAAATPPPQAERDALLAALRPGRPERPLVAIIGLNDATETNDYLAPSGILRRADVADVVMLATRPGPVQLFPALRVQPDATVAEFDAAHPDGADYVIVPAMSRDDDPAVLAWLRSQRAKGAKIIAVCAGAKVAAAAGLLDGRRATTHWYYVRQLLRRSPSIEYVPDRRMVSDGGVTTTTGITASMPMMLTLVEAIAGRSKAEAVARDLGVDHWDARHASAAFRFTRPFAATVMLNRLRFWNHETLGLRLEPGVDEVALGFTADAWSRTYRSHVTTFAPSSAGVVTANGVRILPDRTMADWPAAGRVAVLPGRRAPDALDAALRAIGVRYGAPTAMVVAMQLEYPRETRDR